MPSREQPRVLIAGGSIAGLTLANIFERIGIDFLVLEKYKTIAPDVGASIGVFPNGFRILDQLRCHDTIKALVGGADAFEEIRMHAENGLAIQNIQDASQHFKKRLGYEPVFVDRQMVIQVLYDNLRDKSKVLTNKGVVRVEQHEALGGVQVTTGDGDVIDGDIVVGADGIHSTVRREMWRIADQERPGYFPLADRDAAPTDYCCIFGISKPNKNFPKYSSQNVMGNGCSYLIGTGPNHRIYWFLFKKLAKTATGLYEKIPRYTDAERDALAKQHAADPLNEKLTFGDLYDTKTTATLQALPELVFSKWHYGRIVTIGDAAHKFNPIGGQGGNSAIEDGAMLANLLHKLGKSYTDANIAHAFEQLHALRHDRTRQLMKASHDLQSLQAHETFATRMVAKYLIPGSSPDSVLEMLSNNIRPAARLEMLPVPQRPHVDLWDDERPAKPITSSVPRFATYAIFLAVVVAAFRTMEPPLHLSPPVTFLGAVPRAYGIGVQGIDDLVRFIVLTFADSVGWVDIGHTLQFLYLLLFLVPIITIWYIEASRYSARGSLASRPVIFGILMNFAGGIGLMAPLSFLFQIWSTGGSHTTVGRFVPVHLAKAIAPSVVLGYVIPTILMFIPAIPAGIKQDVVLFWQFAVVLVSMLVRFISTANLRDDHVSKFDMYTLRDMTHLIKTYRFAFAFALAYHALFVASMLFASGHPVLSLTRLLIPGYNYPEVDPASQQAFMFTFLKWDFAFAAVACFLYGLYSVYELRYKGLLTTQQAGVAGACFVVAQVVVGPGAALVGLWWWREMCWASARVEGDEKVEVKM